MSKTTVLCALVLGLLLAAPTFAQYEDDEKLEDYAEQDRQYLERYTKAEAADAGLSPEAAEAAMFAKVEEIIRDRNYTAADSDHFRVQTDDPRISAKVQPSCWSRSAASSSPSGPIAWS